MIRTDGTPTIAWAEPPAVTSEPPPEPPALSEAGQVLYKALVEYGTPKDRAFVIAKGRYS